MCRSIKTLRRPGEAATTGELEAAARQYVRKLSGYREPSARNREAFEAAIAEIAHASQHLVEALGVDVEDGPNKLGRPRRRRSTSARDAMTAVVPRPWWVRAGLDIDPDGRLRIAGRDAEALAREHGTPLFAYDRARFGETAREFQAALATTGVPFRLRFALKANPQPEILSVFRGLGAPGTPESVGIDACSPGEVLRALECGWRPDEISYTGTNVSERDLDVLLAHGIHLNLDALSQIERYGRRAPGTRIGLRIDPAAGAGYTRARSSTAARARRSSASGSSASTRRSPPPPATASIVDTIHFHAGSGWLGDGLAAFERALPAAVEAVERARAAGHPVERGQRRWRAGPAGAGRRAGHRPRRLRRRPGPPSRAARRDHRLRAGRPPVQGRRRSCSARS